MIAVLRSQFLLRKTPDRHLFTAWYLIVDRQESKRCGDASHSKALRAKPERQFRFREALGVRARPRVAFYSIAALSLIAF
jgi:hypothetical protein